MQCFKWVLSNPVKSTKSWNGNRRNEHTCVTNCFLHFPHIHLTQEQQLQLADRFKQWPYRCSGSEESLKFLQTLPNENCRQISEYRVSLQFFTLSAKDSIPRAVLLRKGKNSEKQVATSGIPARVFGRTRRTWESQRISKSINEKEYF